MIDANRNTSEEALRRLKAASYERFHIELIKSIEQLLVDFEMDWDDLADKLKWSILEVETGKVRLRTGDEVKRTIGEGIFVECLNDIAHVFSMEPYILFRPRFPYTQT